MPDAGIGEIFAAAVEALGTTAAADTAGAAAVDAGIAGAADAGLGAAAAEGAGAGLAAGGAAALPTTLEGLTAADLAAGAIPASEGALTAGGAATLPTTAAGLSAADAAAGAIPATAGGLSAGGGAVLPASTSAFGGGAGEIASSLPTAGSIGQGAAQGAGLNTLSSLAQGQKPTLEGAGLGALTGAAGGALGGATSSVGTEGGGPVGIGAAAPGSDTLGFGTGNLGTSLPTSDTGIPTSNLFDTSKGVSGSLGPYQETSGALSFGSSPGEGATPISAPSTSTASGGVMDNLFGGGARPDIGSAIAPTATAGGASGPSLGSQIASSVFGGSPTDMSNQIGGKVLGAVPSIAPLAYEAIAGTQAPKGTNALSSEAQALQAQGAEMGNYLATGTLPPGLSNALQSAAESAKATIRSQYAARGESGSSAEAQDLSAVDSRMVGQGASMALQLYQAGVSEQSTAAQLQESLLNNAIQQDAGFGSAIASFASALAGGGPSLQLKVG